MTAKAAQRSIRERLQSGPKLKVEPLDWPGYERVWIRELNGEDRDRAQTTITDASQGFDAPGWRGRLSALYLCEEDGTRSLDPIEDGPWLNRQLPAEMLDRIIGRGGELSASNAQAVEAAKANFQPAPSDASTSDSPATSGE